MMIKLNHFNALQQFAHEIYTKSALISSLFDVSTL